MRDSLFLRSAVDKELLTADEAHAALEAARSAGKPVAEALVERGLMTARTVASLERALDGRETPSVIGDFEVLEELGRGGMGTVYRARQRSLGREVALKLMSPAFASTPQAAERFQREAHAAGSLNHPNVITCYAAGEEDGRLFLAMELVRGGDVTRVLAANGGRLPERRALQLIRDCCRGLGAIERAGLVHRDIKPANIFVGEDGAAKLADLGLARERSGDDRLTNTGLAVGTLPYMAPEQLEGRADLDGRADIYSLGATLFALLTGRPPAGGAEALGRLARDSGGVTPETAALLARALAHDPADRFQRANDLLEALERALVAASSDPASTLPPMQRPRDAATRTSLALAGAGVFLLAIGGGFLAARAWRDRDPGPLAAAETPPPAGTEPTGDPPPVTDPPPARVVESPAPPTPPASAPAAVVTPPSAPALPPIPLRAVQVPAEGPRAWTVESTERSEVFVVDPQGAVSRVWLADTVTRARPLPLRLRWRLERVRVDKESSRARGLPRPGLQCQFGLRARDTAVDRATQITGAGLWIDLRLERDRAHALLVLAGADNTARREGEGMRLRAEPGSERIPPGQTKVDELVLGGFGERDVLEVDMSLDAQGWAVDVRRNGAPTCARGGAWRQDRGPVANQFSGGAFVWAEVANVLDGDGQGAISCVLLPPP